MRDVILFPANLIQAGSVTALIGFAILIVYAALGIIMLRILFNIANYISVGGVDGVATVLSKRIVAAHREWHGKFVVNVPECKVLDLSVCGKSVTFALAEWIYERISENTSVPITYRKGRLNGKVIIDRVLYL